MVTRSTSPSGRQQPAVVLMPALNEQAGVAEVVATALQAEAVREVVVVDNGSVDDTARQATAAGATVISERVTGKSEAVRHGLREFGEDWERQGIHAVVLLDADLKGLASSHVDALLQPVLAEDASMVRGILSRSRLRRRCVGAPLPSTTGQRAISLSGLQRTDLSGCRGYGLEARLDKAPQLRRKSTIVLDGVSHVRREKKPNRQWAVPSRMPTRLAGPWMRVCVLATYAGLWASSLVPRRDPQRI